MNVECFDIGFSIGVTHLERHPSDHAPLLLSVSTRLDGKPRSFRFINAWADREDFLATVRESWQQECGGSPMHVLCSKLQRLKRHLRLWNKGRVGNFSDNVAKAEGEVGRLERMLEDGGSEGVHLELQQAQASLRRALTMEESLWRQRARVKWLALGDRNTKFFHSVVKQRRMTSIIHRIQKPDEGWVKEDALIGEEAVRYFSSLFSLEDVPGMGEVPDVIPRLVSMEDNERLEEVPDLEEVRQAICQMDGESAAGPDGYSGRFFSAVWEIVGGNVYDAVRSFFCGAKLPRRITATSIVLLPKVQQPKDFSQFRPISLCNFVNKIFSKILALRLAPILSKIISPNQSGFVRGRCIADNYLLAQEVIAGIKQKARGGNVVFKLDMMKAYDRMMWPFLVKVLRSFGFGERWIDMVWRLISNVWFSVIVNGSLCGFFKSARGLRQGDPLSPALFIIGAEVVSRALNQLVHQRGFQGFRVPRGCPTITHLGYADDVLVFSSANVTSLRLVMRVLDDYEASSGQRVNKSKSCFLGHATLGRSRRTVIQRVTGFRSSSFPIKYLGYPLYYGRRKRVFFEGLCQAVVRKVESWENKLLSAGGRIVLLKHVLSALPVFLLMAASPPKSVFREIEGRFSNFLWGESEWGHKCHWIRWQDLCVPGDEGGLGLRRLEDIHRAFSIKLWWSFRSLASLWATFMRAKYCAQVHPNLVNCNGGSLIWRRMVTVRQFAELHIGWIGRSGGLNFWFDNWLGTGSLASRLDSVSDHLLVDFVENGHWNLPLLQQWVPHGVISEIVRVVPPVGHLPDLMVWRPSLSGQFNLSSAFHLVRRHVNRSFMSRRIWHPLVPLKVSFFLLRLLRGRLPVDCCLMKFGVQGPSKCECFPLPSIETIDHVFATGEIASRVWHFFGDPVGISWAGSSFRGCMAAWWYGRRGNRQLEFVHQILPLLICWQLWKCRNSMRYDGACIGWTRVCNLVLSDLLELFGLFLPYRRPFPSDWVRFYAEISGWAPRISYTLVRWSRPSAGALKLNTDGCSKGNPGASGGGGILRDGGGSLILAFSCYFGHATSLQAEVCALLFGVQLCIQRGFGRIEVELDSLVLVHILLGKATYPWSVYHEIQQLLGLRGHFLTVRHCLRQANQVADALSNVGCAQGREEVYTSSIALPRVARGTMRLDRGGVPSVRRIIHN
nr:uncharacterized protein LOC113724156 [Coffea arabica]